jgi:hypothetical protein
MAVGKHSPTFTGFLKQGGEGGAYHNKGKDYF